MNILYHFEYRYMVNILVTYGYIFICNMVINLLYYMVNNRVLWSCFGYKRSFYKCITVPN